VNSCNNFHLKSLTTESTAREKVCVRIVCLGDAHKLDGISGVSVWVIDEAELTIRFLYFRHLSSLTYNSSLLALNKALSVSRQATR